MKKGKSTGFSFADLSLNDYESVFVIDAIDDSYVEYSAGDADSQLVVHGYGDNFFLDVAGNLRSQVWEEDKGHFIRMFNKAAIMDSLRSGKSYSIRFRLDLSGTPLHYVIKSIRTSDHSIILGIMNIENQIQQDMASEAQKAAYREIAESMAALFDVIYQIDTHTGEYTEFRSADMRSRGGLCRTGEDFFARMREEIPKHLHPDDRAMLLRELDRDTLLSNLERSPTLSLDCRRIVDGQPRYIKLFAFLQQSAGKVVVCIRDAEAQKKLETAGESYNQVAGALASRYEVIYYIDTISDHYKQYSASEAYAALGLPHEGTDFFSAAEKESRRLLHPDDVDRFLNELQKPNLLRNLTLSSTVSVTYRQMLDGREQYVTALIVRPKNDIRHVVMAVLNVDARIRQEMSMISESRTFGEIAKALAERYEVIYHVDLGTGEYTEYSKSEKYTRLQVGSKGTDFFGDTQRNIKRVIFPEDYPMMAKEMKRENLLESLQKTGKYILNYRLMLDGVPQYVTLFVVRPKEDSTHIILAVANMKAAKRVETDLANTVESAFRRENRDALTGVKNKHAYAQAESELNEEISKKSVPAFAVVVCNINGLKAVNEKQGQEAGDAYIRDACHIVCDTFKHSPVFRVGGDEFAVLLKGSDYEHRRQLMQQMSIISLEHSQSGKVTLSSGISEYNKHSDTCVQDVFARADAVMYENKKRFKSAIRH